MPFMTSLSRSLLSSVVVAGIAVTAACGSSSNAAPNVYLTSTLGASILPDSKGMCNIGSPETPFLTLGTASAPVSDGMQYTNSTMMTDPVTVTCTVSSTGANTFSVVAYVGYGNNGILGSVEVSGTLANMAGPQPGFHASFGSSVGQWSAADCTFTLTTSQTPPITAGRVWGTIQCDNIIDQTNNSYCEATATLVLQNCGD